MRLPRRPLVKAAVLSVAVAAMTAACSSSGTDGPGTSGPSSSALDGSTLKVGFLLEQTGPLTFGPGSTNVINAWVKYANDHGGIAGHPVEAEIIDTKGDPATSQSAANKLIADKGLVAAFVMDDATMHIEATALQKAGVPVVGGFVSDPTLTGAVPNIYAPYPALPALFEMGLRAAKGEGLTRVADLHCTVAAACNYSSLPENLPAAAKAAGMDYAGTFPIDISAPNFTAVCLDMIHKGVDLMNVNAPGQVQPRVFQDCRNQGYKGAFLIKVESFSKQTALEVDNNFLIAAMLPFPWWADAPAAQNYRDAMSKYDVDENSWADNGSTAVWTYLELFRVTMNANKSEVNDPVTRDDVIKAYGTVKDETLDGLLPQPLTFTAGQPQPPVTCGYVGVVKNNEFSTPEEGLTPTCVDD